MNAGGVLLGSPAVAFAFGVNAAQLRAESGSPSLGRASRSQGTAAVTAAASPTTDDSHAPRASRGVCASPMRDSASCASRLQLRTRSRFYPLPCAVEPAETQLGCQGAADMLSYLA